MKYLIILLITLPLQAHEGSEDICQGYLDEIKFLTEQNAIMSKEIIKIHEENERMINFCTDLDCGQVITIEKIYREYPEPEIYIY